MNSEGIRNIFLLLILIGLLLTGCSGGSSPTTPGTSLDPEKSGMSKVSRSTWGFWQVVCDPEMGVVDFIQLRDADLHLNALRFLEPPANFYLSLESAPQFSGNQLTVDIGLRHPFLGVQKYTGFDVCGVLIADASYHPFGHPDLSIGGSGDTRLLNADGFTRWWNPTEFPPDPEMPAFGYIEGALGTPDSSADYSGILNGYKYFCDDLAVPDAPMSDIDPEGRGVFMAGQKNVRTYVISTEGGLIFNYAVDACWAQPDTSVPPIEVPEDFPQMANRQEAWNANVNVVSNTLFYDSDAGSGGGSFALDIDVFDWFNPEMNTLTVHSFDAEFNELNGTLNGGGIGYSTYHVEVLSVQPTSIDPIPILIEIASEVPDYGGKLPGEMISAYFMAELNVDPGTIGGLPDICNGWGPETGNYLHWNNGQTIHDIYTQFNLASDGNGDVWMWSQRTSNAVSRSKTAFNGDWGTMWEMDLMPDGPEWWIFQGSVRDVSLTPTYDGGLLAGLAPASSSAGNYLSLAWWDKSQWHEKTDQWVIHEIFTNEQVAERICAYQDSTGTFHAFMQMNSELVHYFGDTWGGEWSQEVIAPAMPVGQPDYECQTRTDFVVEGADGSILLTWVNGNGISVARKTLGPGTWDVIFTIDDKNYDSPTLYIDEQNRVFLATRYVVSETEDQIRLFTAETNYIFNQAPITIFNETGSRVDPCYLTLKGDSVDHLFLTFPYRPGDEGAYTAIMASAPGGQQWTEHCVLTDPILKHPSMAIRPDGSIEVGYGYNSFLVVDEGSTDNPFSERNLLYGRSHPGFVD